MEEALRAMAGGEWQKIQSQWLGVEAHLGPALDRILHTLGLILLPLAMLLVAALAWNRVLRRQVERRTVEIRRQEERYRRFIETAQEGVWVLDARFTTVMVNQHMADLLGYSPAEMTGRPVTEFIHPDDLHDHQRQMERRRHGQSDLYERRLLHRNGATVWCLVSANPLTDEQGEFAGSFAMLVDITTRKHDEGRLAAYARQQAAIAELGRAALEGMEDDALFALTVRKVAQVLPIELVKILEFRPQRGDLLLRAGVGWQEGVVGRATVPADGNSQAGFTLQHKDPVIVEDLRTETRFQPPALLREHQVISGVSLIIGELDRPFGVLGVHSPHARRFPISDIYFLQGVANLLGGLIKRHAIEAQLAQVQKMESIGRLAGGVAHDFNNMLGVIIGQAELVADQLPPGSPLADQIREIRQAAEHSAELTRQLLAFARKQPISPQVLDLNETIAGMLKMLRRLIGENIELVWVPGPDLGHVRIDPGQLDQILANLCINARDAIAETGRVTIETGRVTVSGAEASNPVAVPPGEYAGLVVTDNGQGMDQSILSHLFEPFFTTKELGKGTGLGLATVYGIVKQNHGYILVDSHPGRGSTFRILLPFHVVSPAGSQTGQALRSPQAGAGHTILVVEDESALLALTRTMLEKLGYRVLTAMTPADALELARRHEGGIDLLLTDVVMPGMNGRDLARQLLVLYPKLKRCFMSGYTSDVIAHQGVLETGVVFLQKPFTSQELAERVFAALHQPSSAGAQGG